MALQNIDLRNFTSNLGIKIYGTNSSRSGSHVSNAGDVNGDGFDDILMQTPYEWYIIFGTNTNYWANVNLSTLVPPQGIKIYDAVGYGGPIGDLNGDGYSDIIISSSYDALGRHEAGENCIIFGKNTTWTNINLSSLMPPQGFKIYGAELNDHSGESVSGADINCDGFDDIIIGAPGADPLGRESAGKTYIIFGRNTTWTNIDLKYFNSSIGVEIFGTISSYSGDPVSYAGDVNNDGCGDIIIGASGTVDNWNYSRGGYIIFGKNTTWSNIDLKYINSSVGIEIFSGNGSYISGISNAGDVNNDGFDDVIISDYRANPLGRSHSGESYIIFGKLTDWANINLSSLTPDLGIKIYGANDHDWSGVSVSNAGDVNGDGFGDIIIGAPGADPLGRESAGETYIIFGRNTTWTNIDLANRTISQVVKFSGSKAYDWSGYSVSNAGDVNGDGFDDFIIGAPHAALFGGIDVGESYLIFGNSMFNVSNSTLSMEPTVLPTLDTTKNPSVSSSQNPWLIPLITAGSIAIVGGLSWFTYKYCTHEKEITQVEMEAIVN